MGVAPETVQFNWSCCDRSGPVSEPVLHCTCLPHGGVGTLCDHLLGSPTGGWEVML